jgi:hypothetical protein
MEDPMTNFAPTATARRTLVSTLAALVLSAAVPQAAMAMSAWKVDPARSSFRAGSVKLSIDQAGVASTASGSFIVIANGNVYRVLEATAGESNNAVQPADYGRGTSGRKTVLIGTKAQAISHCGSNCIFGAVGPRMTLTFRAASGAGQQISDMLAEARPSAPAPSR